MKNFVLETLVNARNWLGLTLGSLMLLGFDPAPSLGATLVCLWTLGTLAGWSLEDRRAQVRRSS